MKKTTVANRDGGSNYMSKAVMINENAQRSLLQQLHLVNPGIADARVDTVRGSVVVTTADAKLYAIPTDGAAMFGPESYHLHDYGFFFNNIKQNVADRVKAFLEK